MKQGDIDRAEVVVVVHPQDEEEEEENDLVESTIVNYGADEFVDRCDNAAILIQSNYRRRLARNSPKFADIVDQVAATGNDTEDENDANDTDKPTEEETLMDVSRLLAIGLVAMVGFGMIRDLPFIEA